MRFEEASTALFANDLKEEVCSLRINLEVRCELRVREVKSKIEIYTSCFRSRKKPSDKIWPESAAK